MGPIGSPETPLGNYHYSLSNREQFSVYTSLSYFYDPSISAL